MIVCCGEALIDMLPGQTSTGQEAFVPIAGGAVFNTAIAIGRLDGIAGFFSGLSSDMMGDVLRQSLEAAGVQHDLCHVSDRPTTLALVKLVDGNAKYVFYDDGSAGSALTEDDLPELNGNISALHFGAISLIGEPCGSAYEALARRECGRHVISLDPNIRPSFIKDAEAHRQRIFRMIAMADIVKLSDDDFDWLVDREDQAEKISQWLAAGTSIIAITKGSQGAEFHTRNGVLKLGAHSVDVVDTVGAGDSFNGGFLYGLRKHGLLNREQLRNLGMDRLREAARLAMKVAAVTVSRAGANPPWVHELGGYAFENSSAKIPVMACDNQADKLSEPLKGDPSQVTRER